MSPAPDLRSSIRCGGSIEGANLLSGYGALVGAVAGFLWGGIGGRLAMRLLVLTSDDRVRGLTSDDGFEIGQVSASTLFLIVSMTLVGTIAGGLLGTVRRYLRGRSWHVASAVGVAVAAAGGGTIVEFEGIDFRFLDPLWLAVGLFIFLPGAWAASVVRGMDRLVTKGNRALGIEPVPQPFVAPIGASVVAWMIVAAVLVLGTVELVHDIAQLT